MRWHIRSVRARILILTLVPLLSLVGLYLCAMGIAGKAALSLAHARALTTTTSGPVSNFLGHQEHVTGLWLLLAGGLGLLAVVACIVVSLLVGRGLVRELSDLRRSADDLADHRLPRMVDQLATGGNPDVVEEPLNIKVRTREIAQVRDDFAKVQHTAVDAAVGQARLREGIGEAFRNLARRSQSLLHRQLALLDRMERRTEDPQELEDLFRIDHLATRMRRHAESLVILSGQSPARGWRNPVPFVDVIRAAVAEVEDYTRVTVISAGDAGLTGQAVGDVIHMIAELIENATIYSPPSTPVVIQAGIVGQGFAVEIEDRGLGMSDDKLAKANANLADPPPFEPANTDQFGLLVVGQLAKRHAIQITLRRNPYGGTTAIVLIPHGIVVADGSGQLEPAKALAGAPPMLGRYPIGEQNGAADTGPYPPHEEGRGGAAAEGVPLPAYQAAPPAAAPLAEADAPISPNAGPPDSAEDATPPPAQAGAPDQAEAESRAWTGMESPAWSGPPQPAARPPAWDGTRPPARPPASDGTRPPVLPRRVHQASLVPQPGEAPTAYSSLPGRFPDPRSTEETRGTVSAIQHGSQPGRSTADPIPGPPRESAAAGADGADPGDAAAAEGTQ